jgi:hypothetical protein
MRAFVRVEMHVGSPEDTLELCDKIIEKDTADGVNSSLTGVIDMTTYGSQVTLAKTKRHEALNKERDSLKSYELAANKSGFGKGGIKAADKTVKWYVKQIKKLLLVIHDGEEETLNEYGFTVIITTTGARRNIKIQLPRKPEDMVKLGEDILEQHDTLAAASPLTPALVDMAAFDTLVTDTATLLHDWEVLGGQVQALRNEALVIIGYGMAQTSDTPGTIYNFNCKIRDRLLQKFETIEENLSDFGFEVVKSEHSMGRKKGKKVIYFTEGDVPSPGQTPINIDSPAVLPTHTGIITSTGGPIRIYASETDNGFPGPTTVFFDIQPGTPFTKGIGDLIAQLGLDETKPFLMAQNIGMTLAHYTMTVVA